jgi:dipeptide/tripeptide permease
MFDGFWSGMLGGLFGPAIAQWLSRFKYWVIFLFAMFGMHIGVFIAMLYSEGFQFAINSMLKNTFTPVGILVPMGIGLLAVLVAFVGSLNNPKHKNDSPTNSRKK